MSKYNLFWKYIKINGKNSFMLSYSKNLQIARLPINPSFLKNKNELQEYGAKVGKISLKKQSVTIDRIANV